MINYTKSIKNFEIEKTFSLLICKDPTFNKIKTNFILSSLKQVTEISSFKFQENYTSN